MITSPEIVHDGRPKWLIIQLARFGDVIQTAPLIAAAELMDPAPRIHLLVDAAQRSAAGLLDGVDRVWCAPRARWLQLLGEPQLDLKAIVGEISPLAQALQEEKFQRVVNITHTPESAYLSGLAAAQQVVGVQGTRGLPRMTNDWERLFRAALRFRHLNYIHLTDIHLGIAGMPQPRSGGRIHVPERTKEDFGYKLRSGDGIAPLVAIQLGSNDPQKIWETERFAAAANEINKSTEARFVLIGTARESDLKERFLSVCLAPVISLMGETGLEELAAALSACDLLLSNDTGSLHLAAAMGLPTVSVFLGPARVHDTAPYGAGHIVFGLNDDATNAGDAVVSPPQTIRPESVAEAAIGLLNGTSGRLVGASGSRRYHTTFDNDGFLAMSGIAGDRQEQIGASLRALWKSEFAGISLPVTNSLLWDSIDHEELSHLNQLASAGTALQNVAGAGHHQTPADSTAAARTLDQLSSGNDLAALLATMAALELEECAGNPNQAFLVCSQVGQNLIRRYRFRMSPNSAKAEAAHRAFAVEAA